VHVGQSFSVQSHKRQGRRDYKIAFARVVDPLRLRALKAFEEFFFSRARDIYPKYDLARMSDDEFGATLGLRP
jgi:hypothetical protein